MTIKVHESDTKGRVILELDREGIEQLESFLKHVQPLPHDKAGSLIPIKFGIEGVLLAARERAGL